jgi:hypothetical protein
MQRRHFRLTALASSLAFSTLAVLPLASQASAATAAAATSARPVAARAVAAPAAPTPRTVCLKNAPSQCADVKDSSNTIGTRVWLYAKSGAKDDLWLEIPYDCVIAGNNCFQLQDAQDPRLCMAADGAHGAEVTLQACEDDGSWYNQGGNKLGNGAYGQAGDLAANGSATKDYVYANNGATWLQWTW